MHEHSLRIVEERKAALSKGDEAVLHQVGEGKDIMSVCRKFLSASGTSDDDNDGGLYAVRANMAAAAKDRLSDDELLAHMS